MLVASFTPSRIGTICSAGLADLAGCWGDAGAVCCDAAVMNEPSKRIGTSDSESPARKQRAAENRIRGDAMTPRQNACPHELNNSFFRMGFIL